MGAEHALAHAVFEPHVQGMVHFGVKYGVESCYFVLPRQFAFGYLVEFSSTRAVKLKSMMSGKYSLRKVLTTVPVSVGRSLPRSLPVVSLRVSEEIFVILPGRVSTVKLRSVPSRVAAFHVSALLYGGYGGGVSRRAAYAEFLHFFTSDASVSAGIGGEPLCGRDVAGGECLALAEPRQQSACGFV